MPTFSVIVPVLGQPELLGECLRSIRASSFQDYELLVSDDGTPDAEAIRRVAEQFGAKLIRSEVTRGSAAARNLAAQASASPILAFFDSDVTLHPDTLERFAVIFASEHAPDAAIGSYDRRPGAPNLTSQFRNLLHAHVHHRSRREAHTFWTACGVITRERFLALGGFDECYAKPSIEDVEFGLRLHRAGGRIMLDSRIQVTHHKEWTTSSMVYTDLFRRAIPWTALLREHALPDDLNFRRSDRAAAAASCLAILLLVVALRHGGAWWGAFAFDLGLVAVLQASALRFFSETRGVLFSALSFPLLLLYNVVCVIGLCAGFIHVECRRDRTFAWGMLVSLLIILSLQVAGGAYQAEFDGDADEAAHFISGVMVYDHLATLPAGNPIRWAQQYYLHYPKVAIGHWPPGLYFAEALWWLLFPVSRLSIIAFQAVLVFFAAVIFYRMARTVVPDTLAWTTTALLIASPVTQQSFGMVMADALCLLLSVLIMDATLRLVRNPSGAWLAFLGLMLVCALLTKGTGVALLPVPVLALVASGKWKALPPSWLPRFLICVLVSGLTWYFIEVVVLHHSLLWWGGVSWSMPWPVVLVPQLAGWAVCLPAVAGAGLAFLRTRPASVVAASVLISAGAVSFALRAMNQPRHWIVVLPSVLLLAACLLNWLWRVRILAIVSGGLALAFFPWNIHRQSALGITTFLGTFPRSDRVLVSSGGAAEGALVAGIALSEPRPRSTVVRASTSLASSGWNGENYRLRVASFEDVERLLDELGLGTVLLHSPAGRTRPHHVLLSDTLRASASWRECGVQTLLTAWCRSLPPRFPRKPLRIDLTRQLGVVIQEPDTSR